MTLPRYPAYKDSGVEWLGEVPNHWSVMPLKRLVSLRSGEMINSSMIDETGDYPVFGGNGIRGFTSGFTHSGDFALVGRQGALCGNVNYAQGQFWASEHAIVVSPLRPTPTQWIGELLHAMNLNQYSTSAAQPGLSVDVIANLSIPVPSREEQQLIANFLHHETSKIDALIAEQQNLIALLKEKRQAVISHAVTKGLNPDVPMKDSGVEWLGEAPEHWMVRPFTGLFRLIYRYPTYFDIGYVAEGIPEVRGEMLTSSGHIENIEGVRYISPETSARFPMTVLEEGDIVMSARGTLGKMGIVEGPFVGANITANLLRLALRDACASGYVAWFMRGLPFVEQLDVFSSQTTIKTVTVPQLGMIRATLPPLDEQQSIANFLNKEVASIEALSREAQKVINLLQERRSALISAAVTGKIDVRNLVRREAA